jgi:hypothetical protein
MGIKRFNRFPSAVEWNTNWTTSNIDASIYVYDGNTGQYLTWNRNLSAGTMPNGEIPPAQGFWAKANGSSPSITIPHSERLHTSQGFYKSGSNDAIQILVTGNGLSDKLLVYFNESATAGFDSEYDAYKLRGIADAPQLKMTSMNFQHLQLMTLTGLIYILFLMIHSWLPWMIRIKSISIQSKKKYLFVCMAQVIIKYLCMI